MKLIRQAAFILLIVFVGEVLSKIFLVPLPGSILGLLLLLIFLLTGWVKLDQIQEISSFLMNHLAIFFVPAGVGLITVIGLLKETWFLLLLISVFTTILVLSVTALIVQYIRRKTL